MATLASAVITDAVEAFKDIPSASRIVLLNEAHAAINRVVKLYPDDVVNVPLLAESATSVFNENILRVWEAHYVSGASTFSLLEETSSDYKDYNEEYWRGDDSGTPYEWMDEGSAIRWHGKPDTSSATIAISGATNASPIVVTSAAHALTAANDGTVANAVTIHGVVGNTATNGAYYAKVTGYSTTTFALYVDQALTVPVAGNAGYTSGGTLTTPASYPLVQLYVQKKRVLLTTDTMPLHVSSYDAWTQMMCLKWCYKRHHDRIGLYKALVHDSLRELSIEVMGRVPRLKPRAEYAVPTINY